LNARATARLALLLAAPLLIGCGAATKTVTIEGPPTDVSTSSNNTTHTGVTASTTSTRRVVQIASFQSPSQNIGCAIIDGGARCDIVRRSWALPPRPASCPSEVDYGQGLIVERSTAGRLVCAGDTARDPSSPKLPYGSTAQMEDFECVSRISGMTCTDRRDGHGFFLSAQSYRLF
jgi:hypothetical protein